MPTQPHTIAKPDDDACYEALAAHDARFDGRFFVGVTSTGVYCRAVCPAKTPRRQNCRFFESAGAAEQAGFRPCLKCRPELAPGIPVAHENDRLARRTADLIRSERHGGSIARIADDLNVSERHLRRLFEDVFGVTPAQYRTTCRLLLAKGLLTDTALPVARVAYLCGFASLRRFNDAFASHYRLSPSTFRRASAREAPGDGTISLNLDYRPPYRFDLLLAFLEGRAIEGVEAVVGQAYVRTLSCPTGDGSRRCSGWMRMENVPERNRLRLTVSDGLAEALPLVLAKAKHLFDVDCLPDVVEHGLANFYEHTSPACRIPGIRLPGCADGFEMAVRAILGQQITVRAASTLAGRIARVLGQPADTPFPEVYTVFPPPEAFCASDAPEKLGQLGVIGQRARAICALAQAACAGDVVLEPGANTPAMQARLLALPGIGDWTLRYLLMRAFGDPDAFPASDYAIKQAFPGMRPKEIEALSHAWRPWRAYATLSLWSTPHGT